MKEVKGITSLSYGTIACNVTLFIVIGYNTNFSDKKDLIAGMIAGFGIIISILYALQLILMKRSYYRHFAITVITKSLLHICRIITLLYALMGGFLLTATVYHTSVNSVYLNSHDFKFMGILGLVLTTVVMDFTIFFKGWRLLKLVKTPYIDEVIASFD